MKAFVHPQSIVRQIWGKADTIMFIFAGAAAEFALNKSVDWLYFTGRLPADPLGRLFSTVTYARMIIFADYDTATKAIDQITAIHKGVEDARGAQIPASAYRDVLYLLIDYSIRSFELLDRELTIDEKAEIFKVFREVGSRMQIPELPYDYNAWLASREAHLQNNLIKSRFTEDLYLQYRKHLGFLRYRLLKHVQIALLPPIAKDMLSMERTSWLKPIIYTYKISRKIKLDWILRESLLPNNYRAQVRRLDIA